MQTPSANFNTLRESAGPHITQKAVVEVGNFALTSKGASASASTEYSADWPASGVINGDMTHINAGAAGAAENGIGGAVWQGNIVSGAAGALSPSETFTLDLGANTRVNRLTLIFWPALTKNGNLGSIGFKDFTIQKKPDGGAFSAWSGLADKGAEIGKTATTISGGAVTGCAQDMVVFEDPTVQNIRYVKITITKLQAVGVRARLVSMKLTLAVDVSDDVCAFSRRRNKDYHLERRASTQLTMTLRNLSGRFNDRATPTAAQLTAGWFNTYIRPNLEIRFFAGFSGVNCQMFSGFIDSWESEAESRQVKLAARDFLKFFIKPKITPKMKTAWSLEALVEIVANYQNFPSNMIAVLDTTTIYPAYFMPKDKVVQQILNDLQDATGNSEIYFDEFGRLNYRSYLTVINHIWFQGSAADFAAGTNVNNTDAATTPGALILANVAGVYYREGNWYSALSPVLQGKVQFSTFLAAIDSGPKTSVDLFMRVTNDAGVTYTPWREILPQVGGTRGVLSKWNHWYGQVQIWARLRTSDTTVTPKLLDFSVNYISRGGSNMVSETADWTSKDTTTLLGLRRKLTDQVGGANYLVTKSIVKSKPTFVGSGSETAWQGTYNDIAVSATNPMYVPVGVTTILVDFGKTQYNAPQTVVLTLGSATASSALSTDPSKPTLTITATVAGTITDLRITGYPFEQNGTVEAVAVAADEVIADFGPNEDTLDNDYIDNVQLAQSIADNTIAVFGQGPLEWITDGVMRFFPNAQLNDRATITDRFSGVADDYVAIGLIDEGQVGADKTFDAKTTAELVKIGANGYAKTQAAHYGSAGVFYYDNFRFGGNLTL